MKTLVNFRKDLKKISRRYETNWLTAGVITGLTAGILAGTYCAKILIKKRDAK